MSTAFDAEAVRAFEHAGWERAAGAYPATFAEATRPFIPDLLGAAGVDAGTRVLDVASGPGFVAAAAAARGAAATGLDFSPAMLAVARLLHPAIGFEHGDAETLPYGDAAFDAVVSNFGIHHVPHPVLALRQAFRVLRSGGRVAFSVWAAPAENIAWKLLFDAIARHGDPAAAKAPAPGGGFNTPTHCEAALREAGFTSIATRTVTAIWRHRDGAALVAALRAGTARMAGLIMAQDPAALPAIAADIDAGAAPYRARNGIAVPIAAVIASGVKT